MTFRISGTTFARTVVCRSVPIRRPVRQAKPMWPHLACDSEYAVAGLLIYESEVDSGLEVVRGVRSRHDGLKRNPWDEFECGHHYARALSSWAVLLALQGYQYSAPSGRLRFAPKVGVQQFRSFFTAGEA